MSRYQMVVPKRVLGRGTYGKVVEYVDTTSGVHVAAKIAFADYIMNDIICQSLIDSPFVVPILDRCLAPFKSRCYPKVMSIMPLGTCHMAEFRNKYPELSLAQYRKYIYQMARSIYDCNKQLVLHGDIKPGNFIYFADEDVFKLTDFGIADAKGCVKCSNTVAYTACYRPPEGLRELDWQYYERSEVWALACSIIEFVCNQRFIDVYPEDLIKYFDVPEMKEYKHDPTAWSYLMDKYPMLAVMRDLLEGMLIVDPIKRMTIDDVLRHSFFMPLYEESDTISIVPPSASILERLDQISKLYRGQSNDITEIVDIDEERVKRLNAITGLYPDGDIPCLEDIGVAHECLNISIPEDESLNRALEISGTLFGIMPYFDDREEVSKLLDALVAVKYPIRITPRDYITVMMKSRSSFDGMYLMDIYKLALLLSTSRCTNMRKIAECAIDLAIQPSEQSSKEPVMYLKTLLDVHPELNRLCTADNVSSAMDDECYISL